jgi:CSLREA domain-containing protein
MSRSTRRSLAAAVISLALATAAHAAVYIPTKTTDSAGACTPQSCSLREAILAANQNPGDDVILLHAGTYLLSIAGSGEDLGATGDLDILGNLVLLGDGASRTVVDGHALDRVFHVASGVTAEISGVTITNGRAPGVGGGVLNAGRLTLERTLLLGNASVAGPAGAGFGGGIYTDGNNSELTVSDSTFAANTAQGGGGGLAAGGTVSLANDTFTDNHSQTDFGGGLYIFSDARATANNLTISGNSAALKGGGILIESSAFIGVSPRITNSIIAGNTAPAEPDCSGPIDSSYNLIGNGAGCVGPSAANHDLVGTAAAPIDPKLAPVQQAGGPIPTLPLNAGSPALNAGNPAVPGTLASGACQPTDQRGAARPGTGSSRCDIGAFEVTSACVAGGPYLCLAGGRFQVKSEWKTPAGGMGSGQGVPLTSESGFFWFFSPENVELTVKVLNACTFNNRYWFFASGLTNVQVTLTVTDTQTGQVKTYNNPQGTTFKSVLDTTAFATCP